MSRKNFNCLPVGLLLTLYAGISVAHAHAQTELSESLRKLRSAIPEEYPGLFEKILAEKPVRKAIIDAIRSGVAANPEEARKNKLTSGWSQWEATDRQNVTRPYQLFLPKSVVDGTPVTAVIVHMHGAVGKPEFGTGLGSPAATGYAGFLWPELAEQNNLLIVCPAGRNECAWWTDNGVAHIDAVLRDVRRSIDIPDESILGAGFSDGGSGCYYLAMANPDPFAGFIAMNGHPSVASSASDKQLYLPNMAMTTTIAAMTQEDSLYPSRSVLPHITKAITNNADILTISYPNTNHQPSYFKDQTPAILNYLKNIKRTDNKRVRWYASDPAIGKVRWLEVLEIESPDYAVEFEDNTNVMSVPGRVRIGIRFSQNGDTTVEEVVEQSAAASAGFKKGDKLLEFEGQEVAAVRTLRGLLSKKSAGDNFSSKVERDDKVIVLEGSFPKFVARPVYKREQTTSIVECSISTGDTQLLTVKSTNATLIKVWLPDELAGLDKINVNLNGENIQLSVTKLTTEEILNRFAKNPDSGQTRFAYVEIKLDQ